MSEEIQTARLAVFLAVLPALFIIESIFPARRWKASRLKRLSFHFAVSVFNAVIY